MKLAEVPTDPAVARSAPSPERREPAVAYSTNRGRMYHSRIEDFLDSEAARKLDGKVQLVFTSPPFPLNRKKKYGNLVGEEYKQWLAGLAPKLTRLLKPDGSIVVEVGNSWNPGEPTMSTLAIESLLAFREAGALRLCQQFVCHNPARLPSPAQWVTVDRVRLKDSFTHVWWFAPTAKPNASNRRVLMPYSPSMLKLLKLKKYNAGKRPSEHDIGAESFLTDNGGAIPANVLQFTNTRSGDTYLSYCRAKNLKLHPARMPVGLAEFFIKFLTMPKTLVFDPFGGSNVTGAAAESLKRRWVCVEADRHYIDGSRGRFESMPEVTVYDH